MLFRSNESFNREEIKEWCRERCKKGWVVAGGSVMFEDDKDAPSSQQDQRSTSQQIDDDVPF